MSKKMKLTLRVLAVACALSIFLNIIFLCVGVGGHGSDNKNVIDSTKIREYNDTIIKYSSEIELLKEENNRYKEEINSLNNIISQPNRSTQSHAEGNEKSSTSYSNESLENAKDQLKGIVADIRSLGPMKDVKTKTKKRDEIVSRLESIKDKFSESHQEIISAQISLLKGGSITVGVDDANKKSSGHCNSIANSLNKILD